jgi:myo-inositol-1(or 4)-monophosphatase
MTKPEQRSFATLALQLADAAREVTLRSSAAFAETEDKSEEGGAFDPVTAADRDAERAMRALIEEYFPDHGIEGEEFGSQASDSGYRWFLDPIDGTRAYVCGLPGWTTLIALLHNGEPILGLVDAPAIDERYVGANGSVRLIGPRGSRALAASSCTELSEARLSTTDPFLFEGEEAEGFERLRKAVKVVRYGHDAYAYARLAAGSIDLVAESGLKPHDYWALIPVIRGAGGVVGNWSGDDDISGGDILAAATQSLYEQAVKLLASRT